MSDNNLERKHRITLSSVRDKVQKNLIYNPFHSRILMRKISIFFTFFFVRFLLLSPNQITFLSILCGLISGGFLFLQDYLFGSIFFALFLIFDHSDGEVARFNESSSIEGIYYDRILHLFVTPALFIGLFLGLYNYFLNINIIYCGVLSITLIMMNLVFEELDISIANDALKHEKIQILSDSTYSRSSYVNNFIRLLSFATGIIMLNYLIIINIFINHFLSFEEHILLYDYVIGNSFLLSFLIFLKLISNRAYIHEYENLLKTSNRIRSK